MYMYIYFIFWNLKNDMYQNFKIFSLWFIVKWIVNWLQMRFWCVKLLDYFSVVELLYKSQKLSARSLTSSAIPRRQWFSQHITISDDNKIIKNLKSFKFVCCDPMDTSGPSGSLSGTSCPSQTQMEVMFQFSWCCLGYLSTGNRGLKGIFQKS